ncbi:MAG: LacI family transcriptional regulator [Opitutus sp.]|nr:LacI family transcriptional regulator [Opitutus sp.]
MSHGITMKTVATQAGVTQATVSMSLANNPRIPPATRERIQAIARKLGYQPNPYVSTLMRLRRQGKPLQDKPALAFVCAERAADGWRNNPSLTIRQMREGALERATLRGYRAQEFWLHRDGMSNERFSAMLHARGIQGLLISPVAEGDPPPALVWNYFAAVSISVPLPALTITTVCNDHYFSSVLAVRECYQRGYRRPGLALRHVHRHRFQGRWEAGYLVSGEMMPDLELVEPLFVDDWNADAAPRVARWLKHEKPDVIINLGGAPLHDLVTSAGWRIPDDIGFAWLACPRMGDRLSGVWQNGRLTGALAMDTLISMVERNERGMPEQATTLMVEGQWNEGRTLRPLPA